MRTDVKLGVVFSMVIVLTVGGYFLSRGGDDAIPLAGDAKVTAPEHAGEKASPTLADRTERRGRPRPRNNKTPARQAQPGPDRVVSGNRDVAAHRPGSPMRRGTQPANPVHAKGARRDLPTSGAAIPLNADRRTAKPATGRRANVATPRVARSPGHVSKPATGPVSTATVDSRTRRLARAAGEPPGTPPPPGLLAAAATTGNRPRSGNEIDTSKAAVDVHRVQPGDTFATLAQMYYGSPKYASFLMKANPAITDPTRLRAGTTLRIPPLAEDSRRAARDRKSLPRTTTRGGARTYTVKRGDSFYKIARDQLGDANRWRELLQLNSALVHGDPKRLQIGHVIVLPGK